MDQEEKEICAYLKNMPGRFISGLEICRHAGGKWRHRENPEWALPILAQLVERKRIESDSTSHYYRLITKRDKKNPQGKWLSPQMKQILEKSGKDFEHVIPNEDLEEDASG